MDIRNRLYKDITVGVTVTTGVFSFMSGEFIMSSLLFGLASIFSNIEHKNDSE